MEILEDTMETEITDKMNWDELTFSITPTRSMYVATSNMGEEWQRGDLVPYGNLSLSPAAGVLNYGQGVFEGMKAFHTIKDRVVIFRPDMNAKRMYNSAERLCMPAVPKELFLHAVEDVVRDNEDYIPPVGKGSLYIRPLLLGSGAVLGVKPAPSYTFLIYVSPVGPYFKSDIKPLYLKITKYFHRAAPKGTGNAKAIGNYASSLYPQKLAKERGYDEVIYLNAANENNVEEVGSANLFVFKGNVLKTPRLCGSILPGVTRNSVIYLCENEFGITVEEGDLTVNEVLNADEVFCTGTAVVVTPIGKIDTDDGRSQIQDGEMGPLTKKLRSKILAIQREECDDPYGWVYPLL
tara:strand:- start:816 stop:1868 length:1053 start_codon:yes stop_codon:yes gene_type:complete